jgi:hypothetical protein
MSGLLHVTPQAQTGAAAFCRKQPGEATVVSFWALTGKIRRDAIGLARYPA